MFTFGYDLFNCLEFHIFTLITLSGVKMFFFAQLFIMQAFWRNFLVEFDWHAFVWAFSLTIAQRDTSSIASYQSEKYCNAFVVSLMFYWNYFSNHFSVRNSDASSFPILHRIHDHTLLPPSNGHPHPPPQRCLNGQQCWTRRRGVAFSMSSAEHSLHPVWFLLQIDTISIFRIEN